uniref:Uncharacterized protein n=1 Tax=Anguilla anguilla TaxID=7936 RepID=A0A0E9W8X2_ANGAN
MVLAITVLLLSFALFSFIGCSLDMYSYNQGFVKHSANLK